MSDLEINTNSNNLNNLSEKLIKDSSYSKIEPLEIEIPSNLNSQNNKNDFYTSIESDYKYKLFYPNNCLSDSVKIFNNNIFI